MTLKVHRDKGRQFLNRRNFLRGAAGVSLGLPFLEGLPERSAWAQDDKPIFSFFVCAVDGCFPENFFPAETGPLVEAEMAASDRATVSLARHAQNLLFLSNINWVTAPMADAHIEGLCQVLTARPHTGSATSATSSGPSADAVIASILHPDLSLINLYGGNLRNGYAAQRLSFTAAGELAPVIDSPYTLYQQLVGLTVPGGMTPEGDPASELLLTSRNSIHDLVREELQDLMANPRLSAADRQRLDQHFQAVRDAEVIMDGMGNDAVEACSTQGLDVTKIEALEEYMYNSRATEEIVGLHMSLVALMFACNYRRTATLQWGDPVDKTIYDVPSNARGWPMSFIDHKTQSDSAGGNDALAMQAHHEIDVLRLQTLAGGLDHFEARGLVDQSFVMWTLNYRDGPAHSYRNIPHIIWGNAGGMLKQGEYLKCSVDGSNNNLLLNTLITAAIQDTGQVVEDFGEGDPGLLEDILA